MSGQHTGGESVDPADGAWLIRSHYWGCWHRRSSEGGACGYTNDIAHAGVFDLRIARGYNDPRGGRDSAIPVSKAIADMEKRLAVLTAERDAFAATIEQVRAAIALASPSRGEDHE